MFALYSHSNNNKKIINNRMDRKALIAASKNKIITLPFIPKVVDVKDLDDKGMLLSSEEVSRLMAMQLSNGHHHKNDINCKYNILVKEGEYYAVYYGYKHDKLLGKGVFGSVKICQNLLTGEWAAKKLMLDRDVDDLTVWNETRMLEKLDMLTKVQRTNHAFMFHRKTHDGLHSKYEFLLKYIHGEELYDLMCIKEQYFPQKFKIDLSLKLVNQLRRLGMHNVVHSDLHTGNIMYDYIRNEAHFVDFGLSHDFVTLQTDVPTMAGIIRDLTGVMLPEYFNERGIDTTVGNVFPLLDIMTELLQAERRKIDSDQDSFSVGVLDVSLIKENDQLNLTRLTELSGSMKQYPLLVLIDSGDEIKKSDYAMVRQLLERNKLVVYDKIIIGASMNQLSEDNQLADLMYGYLSDYAFRFYDATTHCLMTQCSVRGDEEKDAVPVTTNSLRL